MNKMFVACLLLALHLHLLSSQTVHASTQAASMASSTNGTSHPNAAAAPDASSLLPLLLAAVASLLQCWS